MQAGRNLGMPVLSREWYLVPHSLIQLWSPLWACSLLHWETQGRREQLGRREHVLGFCGMGWHPQGSAAAQTCTGL